MQIAKEVVGIKNFLNMYNCYKDSLDMALLYLPSM